MYKILGEELSAHLKAKDTPGVFSQGLVVYSGAGDEVLFEQLLDVEIVSQVASFCEEKGVSLIAYSGDDIVSVLLLTSVPRFLLDFQMAEMETLIFN